MKKKMVMLAICLSGFCFAAQAQTGRGEMGPKDAKDVKDCKDKVDRNYDRAKGGYGEPNKDARENSRAFDKDRCNDPKGRNNDGSLKGGYTYGTGKMDPGSKK